MSLTCDQCRLRKIKCGGGSPCVRCRKARIECSRNYAHQRRGAKSGNGRVIRQIRTDQFNARAGNVYSSADMGFKQLQEDQLESSWEQPQHLGSDATMASIQGTNQDLTPMTDSGDSNSVGGSLYMTSHDTNETIIDPSSPASSHEMFQRITREDRSMVSVPRANSAPGGFPSPESISRSLDWHLPWELATRPSPTSSSTFRRSALPEKSMKPSIPTSYPVIDGMGCSENRLLQLKGNHSMFDEPAIVTLAEKTGLPALLFSQCLKQYFRHLHASYPVLQESSFMAALREPMINKERECLVLSICAFTVLRATPFLSIRGNSQTSLSKRMVSYCQTIRSAFDWVEKATLMTVITAYFLCMTYYDLEQKRSYEYYLREACQLAYADDLTLDFGGGVETIDVGKVLHERILILLYITNRSGGVQRHKAILQMARNSIPSLVLDQGDDLKLNGLQLLTDLFDLVDEDFMNTWLLSSCESSAQDIQCSHLLSNKRSIDQLSLDVSNVTETQRPDLLVTLRWLRLAYWQLLLKKGLVSSAATDHTLSYRYPMDIAQDLCEDLQELPMEVVLRHGRCILEKVFDITYTLTDCLAIAGIPHNESPSLVYLLNYLSCAPEIHYGFAGVLMKHIEGYTTTTRTV